MSSYPLRGYLVIFDVGCDRLSVRNDPHRLHIRARFETTRSPVHYHVIIVPCVSSTIHGGIVRAAVESLISVRTPCQCISTSRKRMWSRVFGRRTDFRDQSS